MNLNPWKKKISELTEKTQQLTMRVGELEEELRSVRDQEEMLQKQKELEVEVQKRTLEEKKKIERMEQQLAEDMVKVENQIKFGELGEVADEIAYVLTKMKGLSEKEQRTFKELLLSRADNKEIDLKFAKGSHLLDRMKDISPDVANRFALATGLKPPEEFLEEAPRKPKRVKSIGRRKK